MNEPITEAVGDTQMAPQAYAWSEEAPTEPWPRHDWRKARKAVLWLVPAVAIVAVVLTSGYPRHDSPPPPAPAATPSVPLTQVQDDAYLQLLVAAGWDDLSLWTRDDRLHAITLGHWICDYLKNGGTRAGVLKDLDGEPVPDTSDAQNHTNDVARLNAAITAYCPQYGLA